MQAHYSHTITHNLIVFNGVRECFAFAKPLKPTLKPYIGKECVFFYAWMIEKKHDCTTSVTVAQPLIFHTNPQKLKKIGIHRSDLSDAYFSVPVQNIEIWVA